MSTRSVTGASAISSFATTALLAIASSVSCATTTATTQTGSIALDVYNADGTYGNRQRHRKSAFWLLARGRTVIARRSRRRHGLLRRQYGQRALLESDVRAGNGTTVASFSARTTRPTVDDTGNAHPTAGGASVALDPAAAASIATSAAYDAFLTPDGDTRGFYVASRTPRGFTVRESQGGRSSVAIEYRIVAIAAGRASQHMFAIDPNVLPHVDVPTSLARTRP